MANARATAGRQRHLAAWTAFVLVASGSAGVWSAQPAATIVPRPVRIPIETSPVPLSPGDPTRSTLGRFRYAGGLDLKSSGTDLMHELSDIVVTAENRLTSVGDGGILLEARLILDDSGRLAGIADGQIARLAGTNGRPLFGQEADAEGLALLPSGDRLISFERHPRIWLYPKDGGLPRDVPAPHANFASNAGIEALTTDPDAGPDVYIAGDEANADTWTCRLDDRCQRGPTIEKPVEFGLVSMHRFARGTTAYLLRAYDATRRNRVTLKIVRDGRVIDRLDLAPPLTVDNFEGVASVALAGGGRRFYLVSDDNARPSQRTLLLAFDWSPGVS